MGGTLSFDLRSCYPHVAAELVLLRAHIGAAVHHNGARLAAYGAESGRQRDLATMARALFIGEMSEIALTPSGQSALVAAFSMYREKLVAIEERTFPLAIAILQELEIEVITVDADEHGPRLEALRRAASSGAEALYLMSSVHNPLGTTIELGRRREIVDLARRFDIAIIEDAAYAFLESRQIPSFLELAPERTLHVVSLSKMISLAVSMGALAFPRTYMKGIGHHLRVSVSIANPIMVSAVARLATSGAIEHLVELKRREGAIRQKLASSLLGHRSRGHPNGWFVTLELPEGASSADIVSNLESVGIQISDGRLFAPDSGRPSFVRVSLGGEQRRESLCEGLSLLSSRLADLGL